MAGRWPSLLHEQRKGDFDVYAKDLDRGSSETAVLTGPDDTDPVAWTSDGRLVFQGSEPDGAYPLKLLEDVREPAQARRLTEQHVENGGSLSPDAVSYTHLTLPTIYSV